MLATSLSVKSRFSQLLVLTAMAAISPAARATKSETPPAIETPWKIHQTTSAIYPLRLRQAGVRHGEAHLRVSITAAGKLSDVLVIASTHREFGEEALRTIKEWRFEPARIDGEPVGVVGDVVFEFTVNGPIAIEKRLAATGGPREEDLADYAYKAQGTKRLDRIPTPKHVVPPVYPKEWADRGIVGHATVEFYIDETGTARVPVATSAAHPYLAAAAVAAVSQWRFEPPTRDGKPVLACLEQDFNFDPQR